MKSTAESYSAVLTVLLSFLFTCCLDHRAVILYWAPVSRGVSQHGHFHLSGHHPSSQRKYSPGVFVCSHPQVGASCQLHGGPQHSQPPQQDLLGQPSALGQDRSPWVQPALIRRHGAEKGLRRVIRWCNAAKCENSDTVVWWGTSNAPLNALTDERLAAPPTCLIENLRRGSGFKNWNVMLINSLSAKVRVLEPGPKSRQTPSVGHRELFI